MGSKHTFSEENLNDNPKKNQKYWAPLDTTLEIMGKNNKNTQETKNMVNEKSAQFFKEVFRQFILPQRRRILKLLLRIHCSHVFLVTFNDTEKVFQISIGEFQVA